MSAQVQQASMLSGRQLVLAVTVALHAAAISGLMAWRIAEVMIQTPDVPIQLQDLKPDPPRIPPPPTNEKPIIEAIRFDSLDGPALPPMEVESQIRVDSDTKEVSISGGSGAPLEQQALIADTPLTYRATRAPDDYYPPQAIRLEQEGVTVVRACIDATGMQSALPQVVKSSRSRLLDAAATAWARESLQFTPATHAGVAMPACKDFRINFKLH